MVTYDDAKRQANIVKHDNIDLAQCERIEREAGPHLISCRYGDKYETKRYFKAFI
jgi:uncharacterized DUF497 family protein